MNHLIFSNETDKRLIDDTPDRNEVLVLLLTDKLSDDPDVVQSTLRVRIAHRRCHEVYVRLLARMVEPILATRDRMQIEVDTDTILPAPSEQAQDVFPADLGEEGLVVPDVDRPEGNRDTHEIEASASNLCDILFGDERVVVVLQLLDATSGGGVVDHRDGERPFVYHRK